jgi:hypothetical protein
MHLNKYILGAFTVEKVGNVNPRNEKHEYCILWVSSVFSP